MTIADVAEVEPNATLAPIALCDRTFLPVIFYGSWKLILGMSSLRGKLCRIVSAVDIVLESEQASRGLHFIVSTNSHQLKLPLRFPCMRGRHKAVFHAPGLQEMTQMSTSTT